MLIRYWWSNAQLSIQEAEWRQREQQILAVPKTIKQVKEWGSKTANDKSCVVIEPGFPAINEAAANLTKLGLSHKGIQQAQMRVGIPGKVPAIGEQLVLQNCHEHKAGTESYHDVDEGNKAKFALE